MEMTSEAVLFISNLCKEQGLAKRVTAVHLLGDLATIGYQTEDDVDCVLTGYLRAGMSIPARVADTLRVNLERGRPVDMIPNHRLSTEPYRAGGKVVMAITQRFSRTGAFKAQAAWVIGTMYLVYGEYLDRLCIITGNYHGPETIPDAVQVAIEVGAVQYTTSVKDAGYSIRIDGNTFNLPQG